MAAFATTGELASWLQTTVDSSAATLALNVASSAIRTYCGWAISAETVTAELHDGTGARSLWLPTLKLTEVLLVVADGVTLVAGTDFDWTSYGKLIRNGRWPRTARSVAVTYTHGYSVVPDVVKGICLTIAARAYDNPRGDKSHAEGMGIFTESATFADSSAGSLSELERSALGKFQLEHVG